MYFCRTQGGCVASIKPEYLMSLADYKIWCNYERELHVRKSKSSFENLPKTEEEEAIEEHLFEAVSKRAWTHILLQIYKVNL